MKETLMDTQLLLTFSKPHKLNETIDSIVACYDVIYKKIFVLQNSENYQELICSYNVSRQSSVTFAENTISVHRKKDTNTLYTINALNVLISDLNNGVLDSTFMVPWEHYRNVLLLTSNTGDLKKIYTKIFKIVEL